MKKFLRGMLCVGVVALACMAGKAYAGEKANVVVTTASNKAIASGVQSVTGSSTFSSGLGTVTAVIANGDTMGADVGVTTGTSSGANITLKVYGAGTTTLSGTAAVVNWLAFGTP